MLVESTSMAGFRHYSAVTLGRPVPEPTGWRTMRAVKTDQEKHVSRETCAKSVD